MQRSWHKARFLIACSALLAYLPGCGPSEVELKLIVTKQGSNTPEVELVFPGAEPRVELDEGETYEFTLLGRLKGDTQFVEPPSATAFRASLGDGPYTQTFTAMTSVKEMRFAGEPGRWEGDVFRPSGDPVTQGTLTLAIRGVTPTLALEVVGRGSVMIDEQEFREGRSTVDFNVGDTPRVTVTDHDAFLGWSGSCVGVAGIDVNAPEFMLNLGRGDQLDCKAEFLPSPVQVSVQMRSSDGSLNPGRVTSVGATIDGTSINCTSSEDVCQVMTEQQTDLHLEVETNDDFIFTGWADNACDALAQSGSKEIKQDLSCTAMFRPACAQLQVNIPSGTDRGDYTALPGETSSFRVEVGTVFDRPLAVEYAIFNSGDAAPEFRAVDLGSTTETAVSFEVEHGITVFGRYTFQLRVTHDGCGTIAEEVRSFEFQLRGE